MISLHRKGLTDEVAECLGCKGSPCCRFLFVELVEEDFNTSFPYKTTSWISFVVSGLVRSGFAEMDEYADLLYLDVEEDGTCVYFKEGKCSIYENRPYVCRAFNCQRGCDGLDEQWQWLKRMDAAEREIDTDAATVYM